MVAAISTEGFSEIFGGVQRRIGLDVLVCFFWFFLKIPSTQSEIARIPPPKFY